MSLAKELETTQATIQDTTENVIFPQGDLYSDEPPLESELHLRQIILLLTCLEWLWQDRNDFYAAGNLTIYYSHKKRRNEDFRGPDFFVVLDTETQNPQKLGCVGRRWQISPSNCRNSLRLNCEY